MKYFCSKCGKTTIYNLSLPKFCSYCGQSFASVSSKPIPTSIHKNELKLKENKHQEDDYIIEDEIIPNIDFKKIKPAFKLDVYKPSNETFGSLLDNPSSTPSNAIINTNIVKKSEQEILSEFKNEAGSLRSK